ncbi:MAG: Hsp20/alpha crystallin family protein [Chloroflexota bacterium]
MHLDLIDLAPVTLYQPRRRQRMVVLALRGFAALGLEQCAMLSQFQNVPVHPFALPQDADADKIEANYENGVLEVAIPKITAAKPKKVTVSARKKEKSTR